MSIIQAINADHSGNPVLAAELYEQALLTQEAGADAAVNLLFIYWHSTSMGFYYYYKLTDDFISLSNNRFREILIWADQKFPSDATVRFWTKYIPALENGANLSKEECDSVREIDASLPELMMCDDEHYSDSDIKEAKNSLREVNTFRSNYTADVLDGILKRRKFSRLR